MKVSVVDEQGSRLSGRVVAVSDGTLRLAVGKASQDLRLERLVRIEEPDSLRNGALTGLAIGVCLGALGGIAGDPGEDRGALVLAGMMGNGIIWTALGTAVDAIFDHRRTLYQRGGRREVHVTPVLERGARGAALSVTW